VPHANAPFPLVTSHSITMPDSRSPRAVMRRGAIADP
jgi:hypothetical protein